MVSTVGGFGYDCCEYVWGVLVGAHGVCRMGNPPILLDYQHCGIQAEFGEAHQPNIIPETLKLTHVRYSLSSLKWVLFRGLCSMPIPELIRGDTGRLDT